MEAHSFYGLSSLNQLKVLLPVGLCNPATKAVYPGAPMTAILNCNTFS